MGKFRVALKELDEQDREAILNLVEFKKVLKETNKKIVEELTKNEKIIVEELAEKGEK